MCRVTALQGFRPGLRTAVCDVEPGELVAALSKYTLRVTALAFSPNGQWLLSASEDGTARVGEAAFRVWEASSGQPVSPPLLHRDIVWNAAFSPDGKKVLTASRDGKARTWDVTTSDRIPAEWLQLGELLCNHGLSAQGALVPVARDQLDARLAVFRKGRPLDFAAGPAP